MNALTLFTFITVFSVFESSPGAVVSPQDLIAHRIAKRQTANDAVECTSIILDYQCGTSGYVQQTINIALGCREDLYAMNIATACARSKRGEKCGTAAVKFSVNDTELMNADSCSEAITSGSCPSTCCSFLESASSNLGCCINTYINSTGSVFYDLYGEYLDYRLWNWCSVPLPALTCGNALSLNPPQNAQLQNCTEEEFISCLVDYQCIPNVRQPLVNTLLQNDKCLIFATSLVDLCATNANRQTCAEALRSLDLFATLGFDPLFNSLETNCIGSVPEDTCNPSCQTAVTNIADSYGCCVNVYNNSEIDLQHPLLSYSLWNSCGVASPGFCTSSLMTSLQILPPTSNPQPLQMALQLLLLPNQAPT